MTPSPPDASSAPIARQDPKDDTGDPPLRDVRQLGLWAGVVSLGYVFWMVGAMEMVERLAFYGVKSLSTIYAKTPISEGGLGISLSAFGVINGVWAFVQSFLPVFTGGLTDRYGYKRTIFVSTCVKISGYLTMANWPSFGGFFAGAVLLAIGTAIFKPGIQGTLIRSTRRDNSSMAWGIFYQTVNIGGYLGPLLAGAMRKLEWRYVFLTCAVVICANFLLLLTYREPPRTTDPPSTAPSESLWRESWVELRRPHVWRYLVVFTGFWFMFNALFDVLPAHIDDWVDTSDLVQLVFGDHGTRSALAQFLVVLSPDGQRVQPEGMLNLNAGLIMTTCFLFGFLSGRLRALTSLVIGTLIASMALIACGYSRSGLVVGFGILLFSVGEMLSSPKFNEYIGNFAPPHRKAMYMGFAHVPIGIGWTLEGFLGPWLYDHGASKDRFARELLLDRGMALPEVTAIPSGDAFNHLVQRTGESPEQLTQLLYQTHHVGGVWMVMAAVGLISAYGIYRYDCWVRPIGR